MKCRQVDFEGSNLSTWQFPIESGTSCVLNQSGTYRKWKKAKFLNQLFHQNRHEEEPGFQEPKLRSYWYGCPISNPDSVFSYLVCNIPNLQKSNLISSYLLKYVSDEKTTCIGVFRVLNIGIEGPGCSNIRWDGIDWEVGKSHSFEAPR